MDFPEELLPNPSYKKIECDLNKFHLIRYTNNKDIINSETNKIKIDAICSPREQIEDLSTSLLGIYTYEHTLLDLTITGKESFAEYCEPDVAINPKPIYEQDFIVNDEKGYWLILIEKLQNIECVIERNSENIYAECRVEHTPMRWNYWHFSLRWFLKNKDCYLKDLDDKEKKVIAKKIGSEARGLMLQFCKIQVEDVALINEFDYINQ